MDAIRCRECGDVRWSLMGLKGVPGPCAMCGGRMVPERRRPAGSAKPASERRDLVGARDVGAADARPTA